MEAPTRGSNTLSEFYNSDALFGFSIGAAADAQEWVTRRLGQWGQNLAAEDRQIHRLLMMGTFDWTGEDLFRGGQHFLSMALRYSSVLGNSLLKRIERSNTMVRLQIN